MYDTPLTFLRDKDAPAAALLAVAVQKYGTACFEWEPEVLRKELEEDFSVTLSDLQSDRLQTAITILTTDHFESNWHVFNVCIHLLNNEHADFTSLDPIEAEYIAGALPEIELLRNDDEDGIKFSDEVNAYAGLIFYEYGCGKAPNIFPTALMPHYVVETDNAEKDEALSELYQAKKARLEEYMARVSATYTVA
jgi:hypothetical protein